MTFKGSPNYWKQGQPYLDKIVIKIIPQGTSRIAALKAGEVDYLPYTEVLPQDFAALARRSQAAVGDRPDVAGAGLSHAESHKSRSTTRCSARR